ncbi:MAG TPA: carboxypeptidase regulatory-like domain-containing protein [Polyangia bacterium]|jgi:hypothetical protein
MSLACANVTAPSSTPGAGGAAPLGTGGNVGAGGAGGSIGLGGFGGSLQTGVCVNLQCQQDTCTRGACTQTTPCPSGGRTTASGIVYDPAGKTPLYNVVVYVPNEPLADLATGASCDTCSSPYSGRPIAVTLTDSAGHFSLEHMPVGDNIPLVIQIGKWRRAVTVPSVAACADTPVDASLTRLPRNTSEGHIPRIAIADGGSDALNCLLRKIGVDTAEFTPETGAGRVNQYAGLNAPTTDANGATLTPTYTLWSSAASMKAYDIMLMSCEGDDNGGAGAASTAMRQAVKDFADAGGRVFGSHWHNAWVFDGPAPWPTVAKHASGAHGFTTDITVPIVTDFPKGKAFSEWMLNVGGSTTLGQIVIHGAEHSVDATNAGAQSWIAGMDTTNGKPMVQYFSFNTPVEVTPEQQCGRVVMSDLHVSAGTPSDSGKQPFPNGCVTSDLTPQEKALEFMLFDLSSCVLPDNKMPMVPDVGYLGRR